MSAKYLFEDKNLAFLWIEKKDRERFRKITPLQIAPSSHDACILQASLHVQSLDILIDARKQFYIGALIANPSQNVTYMFIENNPEYKTGLVLTTNEHAPMNCKYMQRKTAQLDGPAMVAPLLGASDKQIVSRMFETFKHPSIAKPNDYDALPLLIYAANFNTRQ